MNKERDQGAADDLARLSRRAFVTATGSLGAFVLLSGGRQDTATAPGAVGEVLGPFLGAGDARTQRVWLRSTTPVVLWGEVGLDAVCLPKRLSDDGCQEFLCSAGGGESAPHANAHAALLVGPLVLSVLTSPRSEDYHRGTARHVPALATLRLTRRNPVDAAELRTVAFGSCANDKPGETNPAWKALLAANPDALVLLGDTPYIDTTDLETQRRRYREFYSNPDLGALMQVTPTWATWDDHDFAGDGTDGTAKGKENARRAFVEHHALANYGEKDQGIYTRFQLGAADVFLLDTRWFSGTESSFADATKKTLLGKQQWEWLTRGLRESKAPIKVLACGMVWNGAVRPNKPDYWMAYPHERAALFEFLAKEKIAGVVLVSGDIHRSRVYAFPPEDTGVPYPLHEFVTSPLGNHPMAAANVASKDLRFDSDEKHQFLLLDIEKERLVARFHAAARGEIHRMELDVADLVPHPAITPAPRTEDWAIARTKAVMERNGVEDARILFLGDSITEGWELAAGADLWKEQLLPRGAVNLGVSGERTENLLWRLDHGQLDGYARAATPPELAVLLLGTNNFGYGTPSTPLEVVQGIEAIVARIQRKLPKIGVLVLGIFPRHDRDDIPRDSIPRANELLAARIARRMDRARFADFGAAFLEPDGSISEHIMPDRLHFAAEGYRRWWTRLEPLLR